MYKSTILPLIQVEGGWLGGWGRSTILQSNRWGVQCCTIELGAGCVGVCVLWFGVGVGGGVPCSTFTAGEPNSCLPLFIHSKTYRNSIYDLKVQSIWPILKVIYYLPWFLFGLIIAKQNVTSTIWPKRVNKSDYKNGNKSLPKNLKKCIKRALEGLHTNTTNFFIGKFWKTPNFWGFSSKIVQYFADRSSKNRLWQRYRVEWNDWGIPEQTANKLSLYTRQTDWSPWSSWGLWSQKKH